MSTARPRPVSPPGDPAFPRLVYAGGGGPPATLRPAPERSNAVLGMVVFLASEATLFASLIAVYLALRTGADVWPPPGQPRLPVVVTGVNTVLLLVSGLTMWRARNAARLADMATCRRWLAVTLAFGSAFVIVQGAEWTRLIGFGLRITSGRYGAMFYTLIGAHALHVVIAVLVLGGTARRVGRRPYSDARQTVVEVSALYWLFVVGVWPLLYGLVYVL